MALRVLHVGKFCPPTVGGIETMVHGICKHLTRQGVRCTVLCFAENPCPETSWDRSGVSGDCIVDGVHYLYGKISVRAGSAPLSLDVLRLFWREVKRCDLVHVHSPNPEAEQLAVAASLRLGIPYVVHWHSDVVRQKVQLLLYRPLQRLYLSRASRIICTSPQYRDHSRQVAPYRGKTVVIPCGYDPETLKPGNDVDPAVAHLARRGKGEPSPRVR